MSEGVVKVQYQELEKEGQNRTKEQRAAYGDVIKRPAKMRSNRRRREVARNDRERNDEGELGTRLWWLLSRKGASLHWGEINVGCQLPRDDI